jgi:hypothetical protein
VKITIENHDGRHDVIYRKNGRRSVTGTSLTQHDLDDLLAVLEQRKAAGKYCDAETAEHTCVMPPGHHILPHTCRACPEIWWP